MRPSTAGAHSSYLERRDDMSDDDKPSKLIGFIVIILIIQVVMILALLIKGCVNYGY